MRATIMSARAKGAVVRRMKEARMVAVDSGDFEMEKNEVKVN